MVINTNTTSSQSRSPGRFNTPLTKSLARLSTARRVDLTDGAARAIKFEAQIRRNLAADSDVRNAVSFSETQNGLLEKVKKSLDRMQELTLLAQDATQPHAALAEHRSEFTYLQCYISDITGKEFNGIRLFGSEAPALSIHSDKPSFSLNAVNLAGGPSTGVLNAYCGISIDNPVAADGALREVRAAIQTLANLRAQVGANLQQLRLTREQLKIANANLGAAHHRLDAADPAREGAQCLRLQLLKRTGATMMAEAARSTNAGVPSAALRLTKEGPDVRILSKRRPSDRGYVRLVDDQTPTRLAHSLMTADATPALSGCICFRTDSGMEAA